MAHNAKPSKGNPHLCSLYWWVLEVCFTLLWESRTVGQTCKYKEAASSNSCSPAMESSDSLSLTDFLFFVLLDRELCGKVVNIGLFSELFTSIDVSLCFHVLWFEANFSLTPKRNVGNTTIIHSGLKIPLSMRSSDVYCLGVHDGLFMSDTWLSVLKVSGLSAGLSWVLITGWLTSHLHDVSSPRDESSSFYLDCFQVIVKMMSDMVKDQNRETQGVRNPQVQTIRFLGPGVSCISKQVWLLVRPMRLGPQCAKDVWFQTA